MPDRDTPSLCVPRPNTTDYLQGKSVSNKTTYQRRVKPSGPGLATDYQLNFIAEEGSRR